jgi:integrase
MTGVTEVHARSCPRRTDARAPCRCAPSYRATLYDPRTKQRVRRQFPTKAKARGWKIDAEAAKRRGELVATRSATVAAAADDLVAGMHSGAIRNRSGDPYKASVIADYSQALTPTCGRSWGRCGWTRCAAPTWCGWSSASKSVASARAGSGTC